MSLWSRSICPSIYTRSLVLACLLAGCSMNATPADPLGGSLQATGTVVDFPSGAAVSGAASVTTTGLSPVPSITVQGATFTIDGVPENSAFQLLASVPGTHRATYSPAVTVTTSSVSDVKAYTVDETFLASLATGFGVTPSAARGILMLHLVDAQGAPKAGVDGSNLVLASAGSAQGPYFLDANLAASTATASSSSGWAVFFEVAPGAVTLGQAANATAALAMPTSPVAAGSVTMADVTVTDGAPTLPTNVSFSNQVFPIFERRGCQSCHSGNGPGRDLGNLTLDGSTNLVYRELTGTEDPRRVVVSAPETSLVLTMPSYEDPPDAHPNVTFTGPSDPDYQTILVWIREGAKEN